MTPFEAGQRPNDGGFATMTGALAGIVHHRSKMLKEEGSCRDSVRWLPTPRMSDIFPRASALHSKENVKQKSRLFCALCRAGQLVSM